jgi:hypothetical protein
MSANAALGLDLRSIRDQLEANSRRARAIAEPLDAAALAWRPAPKSWSIAECLDHLVVTTEVFLPGLDRAAARARERRLLAPGPFALNRWGRLLVWYVEPPPPIRLPAPKPLRPVRRGSPELALQRFLASQELVSSRLPTLAGLDLARAVYVSPIARYIRMSLLAFLEVHTAHERRHLWQAERVRDAAAAAAAGPTPQPMGTSED